jgi:hypothetical protein
MLPDEISPSTFTSLFLWSLFPSDGGIAFEVMTEGDGQGIRSIQPGRLLLLEIQGMLQHFPNFFLGRVSVACYYLLDPPG